MSFIQELHKKRSRYGDPDQATMQENSLEKLSSGIYTEGERFIFELLQNAVDAHSSSDRLDISIDIQNGYLVFMHNGDAFTNEDIEGICFVGRKGDKETNTKKIGYKGIGFKSVFGISSKVYIHTANQCFKFDKDYWYLYWDKIWGPKPQDLSQYTMPWQVIPIEAQVPINLDEGNANVATYISIDKDVESNLIASIKGLMKSGHFLIFLKDSNIKMTFKLDGNTQYALEKTTQNGEVILYVDEREDSRWLVYQNSEVPLNLSDEQKRKIEKHKSTPDKLKNATSFDLSFAIAIEHGELKKVDDSSLYTYLPTSYKFGDGFPFLVNANFITDEGRQHLDVDSEWNKVLVSKIPEEYIKWIATLSRRYSNYYEVLPKKSYGSSNDLLKSYRDAMKEAIRNIAFIPSMESAKLLRASETTIDRLGLSTLIGSSIILRYLNQKNGTDFDANSFATNKGVSVLKSYGVVTFDKDDLQDLFKTEDAFTSMSVEEDARLVKFLYDYYLENKSEQRAFLENLSSTKFILSSNGVMNSPSELQFPSDFKNEFSEDALVMDKALYRILGGLESAVCTWLAELGLQKASDLSVIKQVICRPGFITEENALDVGKFLFRVYKREKDLFSHIPNTYNIMLLTQKGNLIKPKEAYLSSAYRPDVDLEAVYDEDIFVSIDYIDDDRDRDLYRAFFRELGVSYSLEMQLRIFSCKQFERVKYFQTVIEETKNKYWVSLSEDKYYFSPQYFRVMYVPLLSYDRDNYKLSKLVWDSVLLLPIEECSRELIIGQSGSISRQLSYAFFSSKKQSFLRDMIETVQRFPASDGSMQLARDLFYNSEINRTLAGKYLPIIEVDSIIDDSWEEILRLKKDLNIKDLLEILDHIAEDPGSLADNKERICRVYDRILELGINSKSAQNTIKSWAINARILSNEEKFVAPSELMYISFEEHKNKKQVYIDKSNNKDGVLKLLGLMGVRIITETNVVPVIEGDILDTDVSTRLLSTLPALAVLAKGRSQQKTYQECKSTLQKKIENTSFYQCESISLAYDDSGDTVPKITFALDARFYYTGGLSPSKIEPLLRPLCAYLGISGKERELFVFMTESEFSSIIEYLEDQEYDVKELKAEIVPIFNREGSVVSIGGLIGEGIDKVTQLADNNEAKNLVLEKLRNEGFDTSDAISEFSIISGVTREGVTYPLVVKSCKNWNQEIFLNPNEWKQLLKPNSMLWLHYGDRVVLPIKAQELFSYQDKLTLTFDTLNLLMDDRINKIMEVLHFFNNIHLNLVAFKPKRSRAEDLEEYLFDSNRPINSDLSISEID